MGIVCAGAETGVGSILGESVTGRERDDLCQMPSVYMAGTGWKRWLRSTLALLEQQRTGNRGRAEDLVYVRPALPGYY